METNGDSRDSETNEDSLESEKNGDQWGLMSLRETTGV